MNAVIQSERLALLEQLDDDLLKGGVTLSEWCVFIVQDVDSAYLAGADLAVIITAMAGIETYLRSQVCDSNRQRLVDLVENSDLPEQLKLELQALRKFRNKWVHVLNPNEDQDILNNPAKFSNELEIYATRAVCALRATIYSDQWI